MRLRSMKRLLLSDFHLIRSALIFTTMAYLVVHVFNYFVTGLMAKGLAQNITLLINIFTIMTALIVPIVQAFKIWSEEWKLNTITMLFSLPMERASIYFSKLIIILFGYIWTFGFALLFLFLDKIILSVNAQSVYTMIMQSFHSTRIVSTITGLSYIVCLSFLTVLLSKWLQKGKGFVSFVFFTFFINFPSIATLFVVGPKTYNTIALSPIALEVNGKQYIMLPMTIDIVLILLFTVTSIYIMKRRIEL